MHGIAIIVSSDGFFSNMVEGVIRANGYATLQMRTHRFVRREVKKMGRSCVLMVIDVSTKEEKKERKKRHALLRDVRAINPRIEIVCVVDREDCSQKGCANGCAKIENKYDGVDKLWCGMRCAIDRVMLKC